MRQGSEHDREKQCHGMQELHAQTTAYHDLQLFQPFLCMEVIEAVWEMMCMCFCIGSSLQGSPCQYRLLCDKQNLLLALSCFAPFWYSCARLNNFPFYRYSSTGWLVEVGFYWAFPVSDDCTDARLCSTRNDARKWHKQTSSSEVVGFSSWRRRLLGTVEPRTQNQ